MASKLKKGLSLCLAGSLMVSSMALTTPLVQAVEAGQELVVDSIIDFEREEHIDWFTPVSTNLGTEQITVSPTDPEDDVFNVTRYWGELGDDNKYPTGDSKFDYDKTFSEVQTGKVVSFYMYDQGPDTSTQGVMQLIGTNGQSSLNEVYFGIKVGSDHKTTYWVRAKQTGVSGGIDQMLNFDVERTEGWHKFSADYSVAGQITFMVDDNEEKAITITGNNSDIPSFNQMSFADFWYDRRYPVNPQQEVYIDDIQIAHYEESDEEEEPSSQITPSKPITYDLENLFGFTPIDGKESYTNYEYSFNGTNYTDCTANPQPIPNEDFAVGSVYVRLKQSAMDQPLNPPLTNDVAFTKSDDIILDFETSDQAAYFTEYDNKPDPALNPDNYLSGFNGLEFFSYGNFLHVDKLVMDNPDSTLLDPEDGLVKGKYLSMWIYDHNDGVAKTYFQIANSTLNGHATKPQESKGDFMFFGFSETNQYYFARDEVGYIQPQNIKRTEGWHLVTWDYTDGENVVLSVDGTVLATTKMEGFDYITINDFKGGTESNGKIDDLSISSTPESIHTLKAPTNPVVDNENKTFGFSFVPGYTNIADYEYSTDRGETWSSCTANPQPVGGQAYLAGEVLVRIKAIDGVKAGSILQNDEEFISNTNILFDELQQEISFAESFFVPNLEQDEAFTAYQTALANAKTITENEDDEQLLADTLTALKATYDALSVNLENYTRYEFEKGEDDLNPLICTTGSMTKGEVLTSFGKDEFDYYTDKAGVELHYEDVNGLYEGELLYSFPQDIDNKIVSLAWYGVAQVYATTEIKISDSNGNYIGFQSLPGNQTRYQLVTSMNGIVKSEEIEIRRLNLQHNFYWDMANNGTSVKFYFDERLVGELEGMTSFNQISVNVTGGTNADESTIVDRLEIIEKNPVESIAIADESVQIGYFETYDMPKPLLTIDAKYDDYQTTDILKFTSSDENVVYVTDGGSAEGASFGTATVTVSTDGGASDSVEIEVKDFKIEDLYATSSPIIDVIAMGAPGQDTNNSLPVEELKELTLDVNESKVVNTVITPSNATARLVEWTSSNENVAFVKDGLVTGVNYGEATITLKSQDDTNITYSFKVIVQPDNFENGQEIFVATDGDDITGDGSMENPFASIERARDEARVLNGLLPTDGIVIYFREGSYSVFESIEFNDQDSGTASAPIRYAAYGDEKVTFAGGASFSTADMEKVTSSDIMYDRLPSTAQSNVYMIDLDEMGIKNRDLQVVGHSSGGLSQMGDVFADFNFSLPYFSVSLNGDPMTLSRYPNEGYIKTTTIINEGSNSREWMADSVAKDPSLAYQEGDEEDTFIFTSNSLSSIKLASWSESIGGQYGAWMLGYWGQVYSDQTVPIESINSNAITSGLISHYTPKAGSQFYVYNLIEELDIAGEWYIDQADDGNITLYFFPPTGTDMADDSNVIAIPTLDEVMIEMYQSDYITFNGINFSSMNKGVVSITGGTNNVIRKADIDNIAGKLGSIADSSNEISKFNGFEMCDIENIDGGISLNAGDHDTLERGYNYIENCSFYNFSMQNRSYNPAVNLNGVGNRVTNTHFENSPHNVIMFSGPESIIEFSEFTDLVNEAGDQGVIYTGRDTLNRGTVIRNNYFHDIHRGSGVDNSAIYLDDAKAGVLITDNIFESLTTGVAAGGGRDIVVIGNTFINVETGVGSAPFCYVFGYHIHNTALGLYTNSHDPSQVTTVDWSNPDGPYGRFEHLYYALDDEFQYGKYSKMIDNTFINLENHLNTSDRELEPNRWSKPWLVMPYLDQLELIDSWYFDKNNELSDGNGNDDASYLVHYDVNIEVEGMGKVSGDGTDLIKETVRKVSAEASQGYEFVKWVDSTGKTVSENPVYIFTVNSDVNLTAVFAPQN